MKEELELFALAARELVPIFASLKKARDDRASVKKERFDELADCLNQALIGRSSEADGIAGVVEVFRLSGTENGKRIVHICQDELRGHLNTNQLNAARELFPTRGKSLQAYRAGRGETLENSPIVFTRTFKIRLLARIDRVTTMYHEDMHWDYVRFDGRDILPETKQGRETKKKLETRMPHGRQTAYYVERAIIRTLIQEWRELMRRTEEEIRRLREAHQ